MGIIRMRMNAGEKEEQEASHRCTASLMLLQDASHALQTLKATLQAFKQESGLHLTHGNEAFASAGVAVLVRVSPQAALLEGALSRARRE